MERIPDPPKNVKIVLATGREERMKEKNSSYRVILPLHYHFHNFEDVWLLLISRLFWALSSFPLCFGLVCLILRIRKGRYGFLEILILEFAILIYNHVQAFSPWGKNIMLQRCRSEICINHMTWRPTKQKNKDNILKNKNKNNTKNKRNFFPLLQGTHILLAILKTNYTLFVH